MFFWGVFFCLNMKVHLKQKSKATPVQQLLNYVYNMDKQEVEESQDYEDR